MHVRIGRGDKDAPCVVGLNLGDAERLIDLDALQIHVHGVCVLLFRGWPVRPLPFARLFVASIGSESTLKRSTRRMTKLVPPSFNIPDGTENRLDSLRVEAQRYGVVLRLRTDILDIALGRIHGGVVDQFGVKHQSFPMVHPFPFAEQLLLDVLDECDVAGRPVNPIPVSYASVPAAH